MKCNNYGIPQNRHRLIIVGIQSSIVNDNCDFSFPIETNIPVNIKDIVKFSMEGTIKVEPEDFDMNTIPTECIVKDLDNEDDYDENNPHPNLKLLLKSKDYEYNGVVYPTRLHFGKRIPYGQL